MAGYDGRVYTQTAKQRKSTNKTARDSHDSGN